MAEPTEIFNLFSASSGMYHTVHASAHSAVNYYEFLSIEDF
ncbi:MAG: hypothetical protein V3R54_01390 [Thermodesulfovibrionia bacterium]